LRNRSGSLAMLAAMRRGQPLTMTAATATGCKLDATPKCSGIFDVKDMKRRQADVRDFLITERVIS